MEDKHFVRVVLIPREEFFALINEHAAKPKPIEVEPPEANEYIMVTFEDGTKKVGFYSAVSKSYRIYQENWIGRGAEDSDKRVVAWEYLADWINDRL